MRVLFQILNGLMAALFIFAAALQFNDPDPVRWIAVYLAAAICCIVAVMGCLRWWAPAMVAGASLAWAAIYASRGAWTVPFGEMFSEWEMKNENVVETREMFGLLIVAAWMSLLTLTAFLRRRRRIAAAT